MKTLTVSSALLLFLLGCFFHSSEASFPQHPPPNCQRKCGNVTISFPFGIDGQPNCSLPGFEVSCNNGVPTLVNATADLEIIKIVYPDQVWLQSNEIMVYDCKDGNGELIKKRSTSVNLDYPFTISGVWNRFVSLGCDTKADVSTDNKTFSGTCASQWRQDSRGSKSKHGGLGHCQSSIPSGYSKLFYNVTNIYNYNITSCVNKCSYAVVIQEGYNFTELQLNDTQIKLPLVADWAIDTVETCPKDTICGDNTDCTKSRRGRGYLCTCKNDNKGNPYLSGKEGCRDKSFPALPVAIAGGLALAATLTAGSWAYDSMNQKKLIELGKKMATLNGEEYLQNHPPDTGGPGDTGGPPDPSSGDPGDTGGATEPTAPEDFTDQGNVGDQNSSVASENPRTFTSEQIQKAVRAFEKSRGLVKGMIQGRVRVATLPEQNKKVSIRDFEIEDKGQRELIKSFMQEVRTITRINHSNVAKLLGCCLQTTVPSLVYEYFSDQTLFDHIHNSADHLPWEHRLRIATETSKLLAGLHLRKNKILHMDVKSSNILLDKDYNAKVVEFGVARLLHTLTHMNRSIGYVDPEYCHSNKLTEKSDVYSFGVVLIELLTGKNPSSKDYQIGNTLAMHFISEMENNGLEQVLDAQIQNETSIEELKSVADLAVKCVQLRGEERPTMKEVAATLSSGIPEEQEQVEEEPTRDGGEDGEEGGGEMQELKTIVVDQIRNDESTQAAKTELTEQGSGMLDHLKTAISDITVGM